MGPAVAPVAAWTASRASAEDREAILARLYETRRPLTRARRLGTLSGADAAYLAELEQYIDYWERDEKRDARSEGIVAKLETITSSLQAIQSRIDAARK